MLADPVKSVFCNVFGSNFWICHDLLDSTYLQYISFGVQINFITHYTAMHCVYSQEMSVLLDSIAKSTIDVFRQHAALRQDSTGGSRAHHDRSVSQCVYVMWLIGQCISIGEICFSVRIPSVKLQ